MAKLKLRGKDLLNLGYSQGPAIGMAINMMLKHHKRASKDWVLDLLKDILNNQESYKGHEIYGRIVNALNQKVEIKEEIPLANTPIDYRIYGQENIDDGALKQMEIAMRLPVAVDGALMPDAHVGYGLPIGGVLAVENAVIPYGVGVDIGCRMCLSVYGLSEGFLEKNRDGLKDILQANTRFGFNAFDRPMDDPIFERKEFKEIPKVKSLRQKAIAQIGSSGSGNHFVEFGLVTIQDYQDQIQLEPGVYLAVLSHSGSRGLGANIANHYTKLAMENTVLPKVAKHLAWLDLNSDLGMEYWLAMNLAGDYASACHNHIHKRMAKALGEQPLAVVENHHNFAWKEKLANGKEVVIHRKGATPAKKGELGIIPGSMTAPGFIVSGKGNQTALFSASHGAGRLLSRRQAINSITRNELKKELAKHQVDLIGGGLDEAPFAYKDIHKVMEVQHDLVDVLGVFNPKIVRMDG